MSRSYITSPTDGLARFYSLFIICLATGGIFLGTTRGVNAEVTYTPIAEILGDADSFATQFEVDISDKFDEFAGLLLAVYGFRLVIRKL